jgi:hypothetical protein
MEPPAACPYCDSTDVSYTYLADDDVAGTGTLVFTCAGCRSHVESPFTRPDVPAGDVDSVRHSIPTQRRSNPRVSR